MKQQGVRPNVLGGGDTEGVLEIYIYGRCEVAGDHRWGAGGEAMDG